MDSKVHKKLATQRNEIARLSMALEKCAEEKRALLADLKYWQAECEALLERTKTQNLPGTTLRGKPP